jgi:cyclophilin family peptidyl-prolyl cis-trans isomerase
MQARYIAVILMVFGAFAIFSCGNAPSEEPEPVPGKSLDEIKAEVFGDTAALDEKFMEEEFASIGGLTTDLPVSLGQNAGYPQPDINGDFTPAGTDPVTGASWKNMRAVITTTKGVIELELFHDVAPRHVENFVWLARDGFFDGLKWHRYVPDFVIQGGDPQGTGAGGPGYNVPAEFSEKKHVPGIVAAARQGDDVNPQKQSSGSQFYIVLEDQPFLDETGYTIWGNVVKGMDVVVELRDTDLMNKIEIVTAD